MAAHLNTNNSFYVEFKDAHPSWSLIGCALSNGIIGIFGMFFNFCVIFVTLRSKSLNGTANFLLALCSFFELLHQYGHFLFMFTALSGQNLIEYKKAVMITALSVFGLGGIGISMFFTGLDRLICLIIPKMHSAIDLRIYLGTITIVCFLFGLELLYTVYVFDRSKIERNVDHWVYRRHCSVQNNGYSVTKRRLLRSLFSIIAFNMSGYLVNTVYVLLFRPSISSPITAWFWQVITAIPLNVSAASNGPILYFTSTEYRQAFHSMFPSFFKCIMKINQPAQSNIVQVKTVAVN